MILQIENIKFRGSLYFVKDMRDGDKITYEDIKSVRLGYGMSPKYLDSLIGLELKCPVKKNSAVLREYFDEKHFGE